MLVVALFSAVAGSSVARADDWFPHYAGSQWTYFWSDTKYNQQGTKEQVSVATQAGPNGCGWQVSWTGDTPLTGGSSGSASTTPVIEQPDNGTMCFQDQGYGLQNTDYSGSQPPLQEPPLCASASSSSGCASSLGSPLFGVIWGSRNRVISEPLLQGTTWNGTGGGTGSAAITGLSAGTTAGQLISPFATGSRTTTEPFTATPAGGSAGSTAAVAPRRRRLPTSTSSQPSEFLRIVRVVPEAVWLALAGALLLTLLSGASAVWSGARVRRQAARFAEMSLAALTDPLTGVLNRRGFTEAADRELERARRYGRPLALAYVDVRGLKIVNDSEGHGAGDDLLRATARLLTDSARENDVVGRLGGDEMGLLLVEQTPAGAQAATQRIEAEVLERRPGIGLQSPWDLTVGTSTFPGDGETVEELLRAADTRLYEQRGIELR